MISHQKLYQQLIQEHADDAVRYFSRWRASSSEVEDLVQEVFLEAWKSIATFRGESPLKMWFLAICRRTAWRFAKRRTQSLEQLTGKMPEEQVGDDGREFSEKHAGLVAIRKYLPELSEEQQEAMHLYYMLQLSEREIAEHLGTAQGTIHSRLRAARQRLQSFCMVGQE